MKKYLIKIENLTEMEISDKLKKMLLGDETNFDSYWDIHAMIESFMRKEPTELIPDEELNHYGFRTVKNDIVVSEDALIKVKKRCEDYHRE